MATESDGIGEMTEDMMRAAILLGTRVAARRQQAKADALAQAARASEHAAAQERAAHRASQEQAIGSLAGISSEQWWDHADAQDIRQAWSTAREYQGEDPRADRAVYRMADELQDRYGLDVSQTDPTAFGEQPELPAETTLSAQELAEYDGLAAAQIDTLQRERPGATPERATEIDEKTDDLTEVRAMIAEDLADRQEHAGNDVARSDPRSDERRELVDAQLRTGSPAVGAPAATQSLAGYDSAERRGELRERLQRSELPERAVEARVLTDMGQAMPASEAVAQGAGERAQARPATRNPRGRAPSRQRSR